MCDIFCLSTLLIAPLAVRGRKRGLTTMNTQFRWLGPDDKIVVDRYDDPMVANVSCYLSRAETGGVKGGFGLPPRTQAGSPSPAAPSDRSRTAEFAEAGDDRLRVGLDFLQKLPDPPLDRRGEVNVLVYTVISNETDQMARQFNSISVVPVNAP